MTHNVPFVVAVPVAPARRSSDEDLAALLRASAQGDCKAFKRLYDASSAALFQQVRRHVWNRSEAEDIVQQVYLKIWRCAAQYDARRSGAATWMARIARNTAIDHLRRNQSRTSIEVQERRHIDDIEASELADEMSSFEPTPEERMVQRQTKEWIEGLLSQLPSAQRQCLVLAVQGGLSHTEIATQVDAPLGSVKSWMRRGLLSLKQSMEQERPQIPRTQDIGGSRRVLNAVVLRIAARCPTDTAACPS
jgi:RNA polymerase sigma-70 factor (ECF subfamily)